MSHCQMQLDLASNTIRMHGFSYSYDSSEAIPYLEMDDPKMDILETDFNNEEVSVSDTEDVISAVKVSSMSQKGKKELMNILKFYLKSIKSKPNYIKGNFFKNDLFKPVVPKIVKPYPVPYKLPQKAQEKIAKMVKEGILTKFLSASYTHPGFFAVKLNGDLRLPINAVYLNQFLSRRAVYIPSIDELLYKVCKNMFFTALDQTGAYNQLRLDPVFAKYVCVVFPWGTYKYNRMPQGLKTSVEAFQGVMIGLFGHLPFVLIYLDDILILSRTEEEHITHLSEVFTILEDNYIRINIKKSNFGKTELKCLGFILTQSGIKPNAAM
eukprot:NODE_637_length_5155_cov_0.185127.p1 type:complete len:324 gc:universal NODE_637_length_5155_cov_0.185127:1984-2955(+)